MSLLDRALRAVGPTEIRRAAARRLPRPVFDYIDGGADDEFTLAENRRAFQDLAFSPRVLARVAERRLDVEVLGQHLALPLMTAPTGLSRVAGRGGEVAAARGAAAAGTIAIQRRPAGTRRAREPIVTMLTSYPPSAGCFLSTGWSVRSRVAQSIAPTLPSRHSVGR